MGHLSLSLSLSLSDEALCGKLGGEEGGYFTGDPERYAK